MNPQITTTDPIYTKVSDTEYTKSYTKKTVTTVIEDFVETINIDALKTELDNFQAGLTTREMELAVEKQTIKDKQKTIDEDLAFIKTLPEPEIIV